MPSCTGALGEWNRGGGGGWGQERVEWGVGWISPWRRVGSGEEYSILLDLNTVSFPPLPGLGVRPNQGGWNPR